MTKNIKKLSQILLSIIFWIAVWLLIAYKINNSFLFPSPKETLVVLGEIVISKDFWIITANTLFRIIGGIIAAVVLGIAIAVITTKISFLDALLSPVMSVIKSTPIASFIILVMVWLDRDFLPIFITFLIVIPIIWTNVSAGIRSVDGQLLQVVKVYKLSFAKKLNKLYIPSILPYFLAACRSVLGMAWKAGVAAEVLCTPRSAIGTELYLSKTYLEMPKMFAWTIVVIILSILLEKFLMFTISKLSQKMHFTAKEGRI